MQALLAAVFSMSLALTIPVAADTARDGVVVLPHCALKLTVHTSAKKSTVWKLWTDVANWKTFDTDLEYSYLVDHAKFADGAVGYLKAKGAPKTKFEIIDLRESESFAVRLRLPLFQSIEMKRYFEADDTRGTTFTHEVKFEGSLRFLTYALFAGKFRRALVNVMENLKDVAEKTEKNR